jgi:hypothetical protein
MSLIGSFQHGNRKLNILTDAYHTGDVLCVSLEDDVTKAPYAQLSINTRSNICGPNEFVLNHDISPDLLASALASPFFTDTGVRIGYGYVKDQPIIRLRDSK